MKRTIATSFLGLIPINIFFNQGNIFHLNLAVLCLGLSVANHSHTFYNHHDWRRREGILRLDQFVNSFNVVYSIYSGLTSVTCYLYGSTEFLILSIVYIKYLLPTRTEDYSPNQKSLHALWHCMIVFGLTHYLLACAK